MAKPIETDENAAAFVAELGLTTVKHAVVQTASGAAIAARPAGVANGFCEWHLFDDPSGQSLGIQSLDMVYNISGTAW